MLNVNSFVERYDEYHHFDEHTSFNDDKLTPIDSINSQRKFRYSEISLDNYNELFKCIKVD